MENKDNKKNSSNFFKREGFYVILFACLCVVATVAAITTKNNKKVENNKTQIMQNKKADTKEAKKDISLSKTDKEINNAVQVKENRNVNQVSIKKEAAVSKSSEPKFIKPLDGEIIMKYSQTPIWWETSKTYRPNFGINIKANVGTPVKAVADGEVKAVENKGPFGTSVTIYHPESGKVTFYGNLDSKLNVKKGNKVTQGQEIGKIGKSSLRGMSEKVGNNFLYFQVRKNLDGDPQFTSENPEKYVKY